MVSPISSLSSGHIRGVDSVRALAALSVVLAHIIGPILPAILGRTPLAGTGFPDYAKYIFTGHPAVIAFFVVSGFCIHYPYTRKLLPILPFWAARWTRIMIPVLPAIIIAKIARLNDYNFWDGYILWSIVCELFYYMLYPFFLLLSRWVSWRMQFYLALLLSFAVAIGLGSNQYGSAHIYGPLLNWIVGLPSWLVGCVLAESISKQQTQSNHCLISSVVLWRGLVGVVASILYWLTMNTQVGYYLTMNGFALLTYFWLQAEIRSANGHPSMLENVGKWSFSMYLLHMPISILLNRIFAPHGSEYMQLLSLPLVLYGCYWFYKKVELPAHGYARQLYKTVERRGLFVPLAQVPDKRAQPAKAT